MPAVTIVTVTQAESGQKLLQFLERRLGRTVPRSAIQRWIRTGQVRVDSGRKKPFDRINAGQVVRIPPYKDENSAQDLPSLARLEIVFEDKALLVLAKPAGLPVHGGTGHSDSIAARLKAHFAGASFSPTLAHRLDRDTSGLLLVAKTYASLRQLNELIAAGGVDKQYLAWVAGTWPHNEPILLEDRLEKCGPKGQQKVTTGTGKQARCKVSPLLARPDASLLSIKLLTGRTHQIRVQLASRGHAIIGDTKYGTSSKADKSTMLLHAFKLKFLAQTFLLAPSWPHPYNVPERFVQSP